MVMAEVHVDPEFKALIPPLTGEERAQLEANLVRDGCRDPLVVWDGLLLDGHNRYEICQRNGLSFQTFALDAIDTRDDAKAWVIRNQFGRRNLTPYQRAELALVLKPLIAEKARARQGTRTDLGQDIPQNSGEGDRKKRETSRKLAAVAGVSHDTIAKAEYISEKADEATKEQLRAGTGKKSIHGVYKELRKAEQKELKATAKAAVPDDLPTKTDRYRTIHAALDDADVEAESVDWIITDPPYPAEFLPVYSDLSAFAAHALKPGGSLVCMVGQSYLPEVLRRLSENLSYHWTLAYLTPGGQAVQVWDKKANTFWKPLLWFVKGTHSGDWIGDVCKSNPNDNDKQHHHWGQSESGMADILERFTYPGQTICDPFCGGGTTGVVAVQMNRLFIGIDKDADAVATTQKRLSEASNA
jgi:16S rRNA G966 N2-methylase RsmD